TKFARLLGFYCAEGSVSVRTNRPNSHSLSLSFAPGERAAVREVCSLFQESLGVSAVPVRRITTLAAVANKASVGLLFKSLAGGRASEKRVPEQLFGAPRE